MKKKGKMPAKITLADSQADSQAPSSTDLAAGPSAQTQSRDAQKPPIMKKTCRKKKVDSDDDDEAYQSLCEELNFDVKSNITYERLINEIKQRSDDAEAVRFLIMILINKLLIPTSSLHIIGMNAYLASDLSRISKVDWSRLVLELLLNNIHAWQQSAKSGRQPTSISGCIAFLVRQAVTEAIQRFDNQTRQFACDIEQRILHVQVAQAKMCDEIIRAIHGSQLAGDRTTADVVLPPRTSLPRVASPMQTDLPAAMCTPTRRSIRISSASSPPPLATRSPSMRKARGPSSPTPSFCTQPSKVLYQEA
ncbi:hypothetical protein E2562_028384 [Oryza meyeriana var. granulata]|uniref:Uncharacterized protein n=1 Tax=Oryza meyeriana var. granulata TaxID=110450 RepID=A0A6G1E2T9_9ORYZ|nr:hypothetical protein E2562_028384 [Oryza meyeriana var. granulata]